MTAFEPVGNMTVDSFSMRIPVQDVTVLSNKLSAEVHTVLASTAEILKTIVSNEVYEEKNGVKLKCSITKIQHGNGGIPATFVVVGVHSKMLGVDYLKGMTAEDMPKLYKSIMDFDIVQFTYEDFCAARVTDVDIKQDFFCNRDLVKERMRHLAENYIPRKSKRAGVQEHTGNGKSLYTGHSFNDRKCTAYQTCPYMKVYDKTTDMIINHRDFVTQTAGVVIQPDLWRQEFTLKGKKHMDMFEIDSTVQGVLSADDVKLSTAHRQVMRALFDPLKVKKLKNDIAPRDMADMRFIWLLCNKTGMTKREVIEYVTVDMDKSNKAKYKSRFEALNSCDNATLEKDQWRTKIDTFLGYLPEGT